MKPEMKRYLSALSAGLVLGIGGVQAAPITYQASLTGAAENPAAATPGSGSATVVYDDVLHTLQVAISFSDLIGNTTAAHIHCCAALPTDNAVVATQVPNFLGFPIGVTAGSYFHLFDLTDLSSFNPAYVTNNGGSSASAEAALAAGIAAGEAYVNIHTTVFGSGEIRGTLTRQVPEPVTFALLALGLGLLSLARKPVLKPIKRA
jgi:hypothetical protein